LSYTRMILFLPKKRGRGKSKVRIKPFIDIFCAD